MASSSSSSSSTEKEEVKEEEEEEEEERNKEAKQVGSIIKAKGEMKAWEQHAGVIKMPRYDYRAPSLLLISSISAFLVTCSIKREKSATKEAMTILDKHVGSYNIGSSACSGNSHENKSAKRCKTLTFAEDGRSVDGVQSTSNGTAAERCLSLSLVKLTRSGLVLLTLPEESSLDTVGIVSVIFQNLESGSLTIPAWCHRIFPVQATCQLKEKELKAVVSKLVLQFMNKNSNKLTQPVKFAVGYNRRGMEESQTKVSGDAIKMSDLFPLLDRNKCFDVVASAVKEVVSDSSVDLKSPELSIFVELLPLSGIPSGSLIAAVSILPRNIISVKPKLCIKPLASDANAKKARR